jgi:exodeoxyribonuclease-3
MSQFKIATWNVNSIRVRLNRLLQWLDKNQPDVMALQEVKVTEDQFPFDALKGVGYSAVVSGQRTYNGVAILARSEIAEAGRGLQELVDDPAARLIAADVQGVRIVSIYVPNGGVVGTERYVYKLEWLRCLKAFLAAHDFASQPLLVCGDMNIAPDYRDVAQPPKWEGSVLFNEELRQEFADILGLGFVDAFRLHNQERGFYSWWDYRQLSFVRNDGLRIDHILASKAISDKCVAAGIDRDMRKGDAPSDHVPVWALFELP